MDAGSNGDPIEALVRRHLAMVPYTGYHQQPYRMVSTFVERVQSSGAQGVIFLNPKFCESAGFDTPDFKTALEAAEIPSLLLETSTRGDGIGTDSCQTGGLLRDDRGRLVLKRPWKRSAPSVATAVFRRAAGTLH